MRPPPTPLSPSRYRDLRRSLLLLPLLVASNRNQPALAWRPVGPVVRLFPFPASAPPCRRAFHDGTRLARARPQARRPHILSDPVGSSGSAAAQPPPTCRPKPAPLCCARRGGLLELGPLWPAARRHTRHQSTASGQGTTGRRPGPGKKATPVTPRQLIKALWGSLRISLRLLSPASLAGEWRRSPVGMTFTFVL